MRSSVLIFSLFIVFVLCFSSMIGLGSTFRVAESQQANEVGVSLGYYEYIPIIAVSNETFISYSTLSNVSISTAFMTASQFSTFNSTSSDVSNSMYYQNGTSSSHSLMVGQGTYYFVFYAYSANANVTYSYTISPNNPYQNGPLLPPQPTGIASFGLYNVSGNVLPYTIKTNELIGTANISSILSYNSTASAVNDTRSGATLQLNAMLVVVEQSGTKKVYWAQNTPDFVTSSSVVSYGDNVWNNTDPTGSLSNASISSQSGGYVLISNSSGQISDYYAYSSANLSYNFPFDISLIMNESVDSGGVLLQMGVSVLRNGSLVTSPIDWFDNITINDPSASSAYFYTSGNESTPVNTFYDTELVFGGEGNGESTNFTKMDSSLGLYYYNGTSGGLTTFPSYYSFGGETAEAADNLHVTYLGNGIVTVSVGTPNYVYLGNSATTSTTTSSESLNSSSTIVLTTTSASSNGSSNNEFLIVGLVIIVIVGAGLYLAFRRRPAQAV